MDEPAPGDAIEDLATEAFTSIETEAASRRAPWGSRVGAPIPTGLPTDLESQAARRIGRLAWVGVVFFGVALSLLLLQPGEAPATGRAWPWALVGVIAVFAVVQGLEGWVITPRIVGEKVGLSPVVVIIALLLGQEILGLVGILLALPIAGGIRVLLPDFVAYWRASSWYTGKVTDNAQLGFVQIAREAERERAAAAGDAAQAPR